MTTKLRKAKEALKKARDELQAAFDVYNLNPTGPKTKPAWRNALTAERDAHLAALREGCVTNEKEGAKLTSRIVELETELEMTRAGLVTAQEAELSARAASAELESYAAAKIHTRKFERPEDFVTALDDPTFPVDCIEAKNLLERFAAGVQKHYQGEPGAMPAEILAVASFSIWWADDGHIVDWKVWTTWSNEAKTNTLHYEPWHLFRPEQHIAALERQLAIGAIGT